MRTVVRGIVAAAVLLTTTSLTLILTAVGAAAQPPSVQDCVRGTFLDYHDQPAAGVAPEGYDGPWFRLSQDYPNTYPVGGTYPWLDIDVSALAADENKTARDYLRAIFDYITEGNVEVDWVVQDNPVRPWFHTPWLDASIDGREFVHGLTHELDTAPGLLGPKQKVTTQNWAIGAYNDLGGWAFGQVWCDPNNPDPNRLNPILGEPNSFPNGTAVFKLLFTTATNEQAPFLEGTKEWQAHIFPKPLPPSIANPDNLNNTGEDPRREIKTVRLIQIDAGVRDDRMPQGWAFGTWAYFAGATGDTPIDRMVPVGLQWGNDPGVTPSMVSAGVTLQGAWFNPDLRDDKKYPDIHLGWAGRLAGPLDNPASSCMSCHQTSGVPSAPIVPEAAAWFDLPEGELAPDRERLAWFANVPSGVPFSDSQRTSTDYSLQMAIGLQRFYAATCDERAAENLYSSRGPSVASPAEVAQAACANLAPTIVPAGTVATTSRWTLLGLVIAGLVLGVVASQFLHRRRIRHELTVDDKGEFNE